MDKIEDWLPFKINVDQAKAIAHLEIERYILEIKKGPTSPLEDAALFYGVMAGMAYSKIDKEVTEEKLDAEEAYVEFLEKLLKCPAGGAKIGLN